jgi:hypothetical protein
MMLEWPGRCASCGEHIADWSDAGLYDKSWVHKACYLDAWRDARDHGIELIPLRPPNERGSQLELPMLIFLLMFHFGLGAAVAGWIMLTQHSSATTATILLVIGIVVPLIGVAGVVLNVVSRRRVELIRQALDLQGGWKPGR